MINFIWGIENSFVVYYDRSHLQREAEMRKKAFAPQIAKLFRAFRVPRIWVALFFLPLFLGCEDKPGLTGHYTGTQTLGIGGVSSPITIVLDRSGDSVTGSVTPPFSTELVPIENGHVSGANGILFERKEGPVIFIYLAIFNPSDSTLRGTFRRRGCGPLPPDEPCPPDSRGLFSATEQ